MLFSGCDAQKSNSQYLYDAAQNYFGNRVDVENFASTTFTIKQVSHVDYNVELEYKATAEAAEKTTGAFVDTDDVTKDYTIKLQKLENGFVVYLELNEVSTYVENVLKPDETLDKTTENIVWNEKYYFTAITEDSTTNYYVVKKTSETTNGGSPITSNKYEKFSNLNQFVNVINEIIRGTNSSIRKTFFNWYEMATYLGGAFNVSSNGNTLAVKYALDDVSVNYHDYTPMMYNEDMKITLENKMPAEAKQKVTTTTKAMVEMEDVTMNIIEGAEITVPENLLTGAVEEDTDFEDFFDDIPEIRTSLMS